jgi:hypothetical protein
LAYADNGLPVNRPTDAYPRSSRLSCGGRSGRQAAIPLDAVIELPAHRTLGYEDAEDEPQEQVANDPAERPGHLCAAASRPPRHDLLDPLPA